VNTKSSDMQNRKEDYFLKVCSVNCFTTLLVTFRPVPNSATNFVHSLSRFISTFLEANSDDFPELLFWCANTLVNVCNNILI
jgi:hypothetical protein